MAEQANDNLSPEQFTQLAQSVAPAQQAAAQQAPAKGFSLTGVVTPAHGQQPAPTPAPASSAPAPGASAPADPAAAVEKTPSPKADELLGKTQDKSRVAAAPAEQVLDAPAKVEGEEGKKKKAAKDKTPLKAEEPGDKNPESIVQDTENLDERTAALLKAVKPDLENIRKKRAAQQAQEPEAVLGDKDNTLLKKEKTPTARANELPEDVQATLKLHQDMVKHPAYKMLSDFLRNGGTDPQEFVKQYAVPDVKAYSPAQLFEMDLQTQDLTPDEMIQAREEFDKLSDYKKKIETNPIRKRLAEESAAKMKTWAPDPADVQKFQAHQQQASQKALADLDELTDNATKSGGWYGYVLDDEEKNLVYEECVKNPVLVGQGMNQAYDMAATFHRVMTSPKMLQKLMANSFDLGEAAGYNKLVKERIRVNRNEFVRNEGAGGKQTFSDAIKQQGVVTPAPAK